MEYVFLVISLVLIIFGATLLTDGSVALAARFKVSEFVVGLTIVAVGTSMPELVVSALSALSGSGEMAIGNVVGSNVFNVYAILGLCAVVAPVLLTRSNMRSDIPICILASVALWGVTAYDNVITRWEGALLLFFYILMLFYSIRQSRKEGAAVSADGEEDAQSAKSMPAWRIPVWILGGLGMLIYGGQLCVDSATEIARNLGVSEATIAITLVAGGTSLPELAASLVSLIKGRGGLALGNVLGSNIANILLILGASSLITPLSMGNITMIDIAVAVSAPVLVLLSGLFIGDKRITRLEGAIFLLIFVGYIYTLI
ncbi:MAG: calcium/sodium antiporter [Alistipes sp.]|nr:calcium/sodium antiporter [Alistipes sp.]